MTPVLLELPLLAPGVPLPLRTDVARIIRALDLANWRDVLEFCFGPDDELFDAPAPPPPPGLHKFQTKILYNAINRCIY